MLVPKNSGQAEARQGEGRPAGRRVDGLGVRGYLAGHDKYLFVRLDRFFPSALSFTKKGRNAYGGFQGGNLLLYGASGFTEV